MLRFPRFPSLAFSLLALALVSIGCDVEVDDTNPDRNGVSRDLPLAAQVGAVFGPCKHSEDNAYHTCSPQQTGSIWPVICSIPQEQGKPPATVCVERRGADSCPDVKGFYNEFGDVVEYPIAQDSAGACPLECDADLDCPQFPKAMICVAQTCAWENLQ